MNYLDSILLFYLGPLLIVGKHYWLINNIKFLYKLKMYQISLDSYNYK